MFEASGRFSGRDVIVKWDDGTLTADEDIHRTIRGLIARDGRVGPVGGPYTSKDHIDSPLSSLVLIARALEVDPGPVFTGDLPEFPSVPDGAIV